MNLVAELREKNMHFTADDLGVKITMLGLEPTVERMRELVATWTRALIALGKERPSAA